MVARAVKSRCGNLRNQASATKSEKRAIFAHSARARRESLFSAPLYVPGSESGLSPRTESAITQRQGGVVRQGRFIGTNATDESRHELIATCTDDLSAVTG